MLKEIDNKIEILHKFRDTEIALNSNDLRASICTVIEKAYFLESIVLLSKTFIEEPDNQFFTANSAVNRYFRDWGLDKVADIFNELCLIAKPYIANQ
ncbi:MAG: hypothetical protein ABI237_18545 [Ginsengibacter sp.]